VSTHGGKRKGAGRPRVGDVTFAFRVPARVLARAKKRGGLADFLRKCLSDFARLSETKKKDA
jgi:hypothetical protein